MIKNKIRVILVDDEPYVLDAVVALLREHPDFSVVGYKGKVAVVRKSDDPLMTSASMQDMENVLSEYGFYRCHQSCLIPLEPVDSLSSEEVSSVLHVIAKIPRAGS